MTKHSKLIIPIAYIFTIGISLFLLFFLITCTWIGFDVKSNCVSAKVDYGGNCTQAYISLLQDTNRSFRSRNQAIWALGQLGDISALQVLQSFYTGIIPDREPLNQFISQYELQKAIKLLNGGTNLTAIFWRFGLE